MRIHPEGKLQIALGNPRCLSATWIHSWSKECQKSKVSRMIKLKMNENEKENYHEDPEKNPFFHPKSE